MHKNTSKQDKDKTEEDLELIIERGTLDETKMVREEGIKDGAIIECKRTHKTKLFVRCDNQGEEK